MKKVLMLILIIVGCSVSETKAQKVALKSNLLYDATATMNLGLEFGLARKWTLDIPVNYHPWKPADGKRLRHWGVQPEVRYWFCERFNRTFMGLHGHYAEFNVGGWPDWSFISKNMQNNRHQGHLYGGGVSIGHLSEWVMHVLFMINIHVRNVGQRRKKIIRTILALQKQVYHLFT